MKTEKKQTSKRGGKRPGAGRKEKFGSATTQISARVPKTWKKFLKDKFGSVSAAMQELIQKAILDSD